MSKTKVIRVPDIGDFKDMEVIEVLIAPGDRIQLDDPIITVENDKVSMEIPSPYAGLIKNVKVSVGDKVSESSPIAEIGLPDEESSEETESVSSLTKVFIIHGHDDGTKHTIARFITKLGLEPVILHEQANRGLTIIDKFEEHAATARFAVALLTPDDMGAPQGNENGWRSRARQNVIFELGYFVGRFGRGRVCALKKGDIEEPSDYKGVLYISMDTEAWKLDLVRELKSAGMEFDPARAF